MDSKMDRAGELKRNYDIDEFDWDGEEALVEDRAVVSDLEELVTAALLPRAESNRVWLAPDKVDMNRPRVAYNVPHAVNEEEMAYLKEAVGSVRTLTFNSRAYHDHPVSHALTCINEDVMVSAFDGERYVDVYGNSARNAAMGRNAHTTAGKYTAHDFFRNRGTSCVQEDHKAFIARGGHLNHRLFASTHSLYYMTMQDVAELLADRPEAEFHAIIHRHGEANGFLNRGELKYTIDVDGNVTQENVRTGFRYTHPTLEWLFHQDNCPVSGRSTGLAWDIKTLAGDTYLVKFVSVPARFVTELGGGATDFVTTKRRVETLSGVVVYRVLGWRWYAYTKGEKSVVLTDHALFDRLRRTVAGKERTPRALSDLMSMCRRLCNKADIISIHQGFVHDVPPEQMVDYVHAAFYCDVEHELEVALSYHSEHKHAVDTLNAYLQGQKLPTSVSGLRNAGRLAAKATLAVLANTVGSVKGVVGEIGELDDPVSQAVRLFHGIPDLDDPVATRVKVSRQLAQLERQVGVTTHPPRNPRHAPV